MGVLKFFYYLSHKYPQCLINLIGTYQKCELSKLSSEVRTDWLEIDLNTIFHSVAQEVYQYGSKAIPVSFLHPKKRTSPQPEEHVLFTGICSRIEQIRTIINPLRGIYLAIDGVAGASKQAQQRKRRFGSCCCSKYNEKPSSFDSNCISCGTLFMERLSDYINIFIEGQLTNNPEWKELEIIFNNHRVPGEGEHKLISHMRKDSQLSYTIVSPDADLIFLGLGLHNKNVKIFRENIFNDIGADFFLVDISIFRQCIIEEIKIDAINKIETNRVIEDFIVYCFFIGNDFLPQIPSLNISNGGIDIIFSIYSKIIREHGPLSYRDESSGQYNLSIKGMKAFLNEMAAIEYQMMVTNRKYNQSRYPDTIMQKCVSYPIAANGEHVLTIDFPKYRKEYYDKKLNGIEIKTLVHEYLKGMIFVLRYYLQGIPSWDWSYPFFYSPFFTDLAEYIGDFDGKMKFESSYPLTPLEQLLAILPGRNSNLLPELLRLLSTSESSPIIDMYPTDFEIDLEGKKQEYEGIVCLPHANLDRIRKEFKLLEPHLSEYDKKRNSPGFIVQYTLQKE